MASPRHKLPPVFVSRFIVDYAAPFQRHLNRLEVEIGREDYRHLKRIELVDEPLPEARCREMLDITGRVLETTQNQYNHDLLVRLGIQVLLEVSTYRVYYRLADRTICFHPHWREKVLQRFFAGQPVADTGWHTCTAVLPGFEARYLPDQAGGTLLLRSPDPHPGRPLLTAVHGPYDPHTLEVALYFLRTGKGGAALVNLGFAGREPITDENLAKLKAWGVPLNPSNIDVIYPYLDAEGEPHSYKTERNLCRLLAALETGVPELILDIHGCVGTEAEDRRVVVGLGGLPPYQELETLGEIEIRGDILHLFPDRRLQDGLARIRELSEEIYLQICTAPGLCFQFALLGGLQLLGRRIDPARDVASLLEGEERTYLPDDQVRWLPGAGANALQRLEASKLQPGPLCLHVEIPTAVRRRMVLKLRELEITSSLESSGL